MQSRQVGSWIIERGIGEGGMGEVFLARHVMLGTPAAVKMLASALTHEQRFRDRFFQEARTQAQLRHPHIAQVMDFIEQDGHFFLVIEHLEGGSLENVITNARGPANVERSLVWVRQSLWALDYAHQHGVIHRDVKPSNIMLDDKQQAKVTDFGIALVIGKQRMTTTGVSIGTPYYMSPEQIVRPQALDHRTDVYSMGIVLYELLTGRVPFDSDSDFEVRSSHVHAPPPQPRKLNPAIPETLEKVVLKALAKDPNSRYAGCAEFARTIHAYLNNEPVTDVVRGHNAKPVHIEIQPVWKDAATVPYPQPAKQTKPSHSSVAQNLVIIQLGLIAAAVVAALVVVESIMISSVVLTVMGAVVAWFSRRQGWIGIVFGLSALAVSVLGGLLIVGNNWGPSKAQEPISVIALVWGIAVFPLGIATYLRLKQSQR